MKRSPQIVALLFFMTVICACRAIQWRPVGSGDEKQLLDALAQAEKVHQQMQAVMTVSTGSLAQVFFSETLDVIVQKPNRFYMAVRSFLGPPAQALAFDGQYISFLDISKEESAYYQKTQLESNSTNSMLGFPISPVHIVEILLAEPTWANARKVDVWRDFHSENTFLLKVVTSDDWHKEYVLKAIRPPTEKELGKQAQIKPTSAHQTGKNEEGKAPVPNVVYELKKSSLRNARLDMSYEVEYSDIQYINGLPVPHRYNIHVRRRDMSKNFLFHVQELLFNGVREPEETFFIDKP